MKSTYHDRYLLKYLLLAISSVVLVSCTRSSIPPESVGTALANQTASAPEMATTIPGVDPGTRPYAIVEVAEGEVLPIRKPAGISGSIVGELTFDQRGILLTGSRTMLGSSSWIEIFLPGGGTGWVNAWNLTEDVSPTAFCSDPEVTALLETLGRALINRDGALLAGIIHHDRGLILRHDWWNPEVLIPQESVATLFSDPAEIHWGFLSSSEFSIRGSFAQVMMPQLDDVFLGIHQMKCNELIAGETSRQVKWPGEYHNLNFSAFYRPTDEGGNRFNWRTWVVGVEYVEGKPYLAILVQYTGDI